MTYKIHPIFLGSLEISESAIFYRGKGSEKMRMSMGAFVLESEDGEYIIVDTGGPSRSEIIEKGYPFEQTDEDISFEEEIKKVGVTPDAVKLVILTHLHWDHAWNNHLFPNAEIVVRADEIITAIHPHKTSIKSYGWIDQEPVPRWINQIGQLRPVQDEIYIRPGIFLMHTPGHTEGSISPVIDTKEGKVALVNDMAMNMRNLTEMIPNGSVDAAAAWYRSMDKLLATGAEMIPTHDPSLYDRKVIG